MGRHRTKIDPTVPNVDVEAAKKRKHDELEPESQPNGHPNGDSKDVVTEDAEEHPYKKIKKIKKERRSKTTAPTLPESPKSSEDTSPKQNGATGDVIKPDGENTEPKKPKKPKKNKKKSETEDEEQPLDPREEIRRKKYAAIFAKYRKEEELAKAEKAAARQVAEAEEDGAEKAAPELHDLTPFPQPEAAPEPEYKPTFSALPPWLAEPLIVSSSTTDSFDRLNLSPELQKNLAGKGLTQTLAVQSAVIPLLLSGTKAYRGDICVSAATGSGKTLAYMLPMVESLKQKVITRLRGLVVVPTRELVAQAHEVAKMCAAGTGLQIGTAVGNVSLAEEQGKLVRREQRYDPISFQAIYDEACKRLNVDFGEDEDLQSDLLDVLPDHVSETFSNIDILICTPGRLVDHIRKSRGFSLSAVEWLVIDEADRLLDESFQEWVTTVLAALHPKKPKDQWSALERVIASVRPIPEERRVRKIILSATMTRDLSKLASLRLKRPTLVAVVDQAQGATETLPNEQEEPMQTAGESFEIPTTLSEKAIPIGDGSEKPLYLFQLLQSNVLGRDPNNVNRYIPAKVTLQNQRMLIFTHNNENAARLAYIISKLHSGKDGITGLLTKASTTSKTSRNTLKAFQRGDIQILIATDRASRGLDVPGIAHVISYDMPRSVTDYVHRVGRTARAGSEGMAWTLFTDSEARWFWIEIARSGQIRRGGRSVERMMVDMKSLGEDKREAYGAALKELQTAVRGND